MRARSHSTDRLSSCTLLLLGGLGGGVLILVVALPLALSRPFPTPRDGGELILRPAALYAPAALVTEEQTDPDQRVAVATLDDGSEEPLTFAERWNLRVAPAGEPEPLESDEAVPPEGPDDAVRPDAARVDTAHPDTAHPDTAHDEAARGDAIRPGASHDDAAAHGGVPYGGVHPLGGTAARPAGRAAEDPRPARPARTPLPPRRVAAPVDPVERYLWEVYLRQPVKSDSTGDFTWKDQAAAKRLGMTLRAYVIGGMDPDFREQLYHAGHAMDASGLHWSILSAFRDDYRQGLAAGFKAHGGNSLHGGSRATGGYAHGRAVDITCACDDEPDAIWYWIDAHGAKYGLTRPMRRIDPAHVQAHGAYHDLAQNLRDARLKLEAKLNRGTPGRRTAVADSR